MRRGWPSSFKEQTPIASVILARKHGVQA